MDHYETKDLGCATYLYSKGHKLKSCKKNSGNLTTFSFSDKEKNQELATEYYEGAQIPAMEYWHSLKILKNIIHERRNNENN